MDFKTMKRRVDALTPGLLEWAHEVAPGQSGEIVLVEDQPDGPWLLCRVMRTDGRMARKAVKLMQD